MFPVPVSVIALGDTWLNFWRVGGSVGDYMMVAD